MVAVAVTATFHLFEQFGVAVDVVADHEEGGFDAVAVEGVEHPRGDFGDWAVVECDISYLMVLAFNAPYRLRKKEAI
jgi:hypothetical protein